MQSIRAMVDLSSKPPPGSHLAMATVVKVRGSAYRRPGARMLMTGDGRSAGMISGGCLEADARERGLDVIQSGRPNLVTYDSTAPADIVFGLGIGCNGIVQVLFERFAAGDPASLQAFFDACLSRRQTGRLATVFQSADIPPATRVMRWPDGTVSSTISDATLTDALVHLFRSTGARRAAIRRIELSDGRRAEVLVEAVLPPADLTIFGAADDAIPIVQIAKLAGWHVKVADSRSAYATSDRFPRADAVLCVRPASIADTPELVFTPDSLVIVMTHNYNQDRELLRYLLRRPLRYLGVLGPKARTERLLDDLSDEGLFLADEARAGIRSPAGLDIGAETPEEIAISIVSEIHAVLAERSGGPLCDRKLPIHDPVESHATI